MYCRCTVVHVKVGMYCRCTVVPVMNGHPRDQLHDVKVGMYCRCTVVPVMNGHPRDQLHDVKVGMYCRCTVVPVMNGHPRGQAKVSAHDRWPLVRGTEGRAGGGAKRNTGYSLHDYIMHHHQRYSY